jgi:hypothetical protein
LGLAFTLACSSGEPDEIRNTQSKHPNTPREASAARAAEGEAGVSRAQQPTRGDTKDAVPGSDGDGDSQPSDAGGSSEEGARGAEQHDAGALPASAPLADPGSLAEPGSLVDSGSPVEGDERSGDAGSIGSESDAPSQQSPDGSIDAGSVANSPEVHSDLLGGHWLRYGYVGDCTNETFWLTFDDASSLTFRWFDWCAGPEPLVETPGRYTVGPDFTLEVVWRGLGPQGETRNAEQTLEQYTFVVISEPDDEWLEEDVLVQRSPTLWSTRRLHEEMAASGERLVRHELGLEFTLEDELPPMDETAECRPMASFWYSRFDAEQGIDEEQTLVLDGLPCRVEPSPTGQVVRLDENLGEQSDGSFVTWVDQLELLLAEQDANEWAIERLRWMILPRLERRAELDDVLLNGYNRWQRTDVEPSAL